MSIRLCCTWIIALAACAPTVDADAEADEGWDQLDIGKGDGASASSYGALALVTVPAELDKVRASLVVLDDDVMPHEAKQLRKDIGRLRDHVDLFAFAYKPGKKHDTWKDIRDELDDGYETIGSFKDLFDVQGVEDPADAEYDDDEVEALRDVTLEWSGEFLDDEHQDDTGAYLGAPSLSKLHDRPKDDQPRFYWREAGIEPDAKLSGLKNMARLQRALIEEALEDLAETPEIGNLTKESNAVAFHDFRKRVRSIEKLAGYFPQMTKSGDVDEAQELLAVVIEAVDRYGDINDRIVAHAREKDDSDAEEIEDEIAKMWADLLEWQQDEELDEVLEDLRATVRK